MSIGAWFGSSSTCILMVFDMALIKCNSDGRMKTFRGSSDEGLSLLLHATSTTPSTCIIKKIKISVAGQGRFRPTRASSSRARAIPVLFRCATNQFSRYSGARSSRCQPARSHRQNNVMRKKKMLCAMPFLYYLSCVYCTNFFLTRRVSCPWHLLRVLHIGIYSRY